MKSFKELVGVVLILGMYFAITTGCDPNTLLTIPVENSSTTPVATEPVTDAIVMGAFNIEIFGRAKLGNPDVMNVLVDIAKRFDILAIQELRSTEQTIIPRFTEMINRDGAKFKYVLGPRQGYTQSKEQYVYLYDSEKIELIGQPYVAPDPTGVLHRSPLVASFRCLNVPSENAFSFTLMNIHVDPHVVREESEAMVSIIQGVRNELAYEDDLILLGDVNSPPSAFSSYPWFNNQYPAIADDWQTKTLRPLNRDNIVFDAVQTGEYLNQSGVLNLMSEYELSVDDALLVSDHMPVWAVFSTTEASQAQIVQEDPGVLR